MKGCPPWRGHRKDVHHRALDLLRIIALAASCMRKNGARTFTSNIASNSSGLVSRIVPRSVIAAALTSTSTRPNAFSAAGTIFRAAARSARSAATKTVLQPPFGDVVGDRFAALLVAADDDEAGRAALGEEPRDRLAKPLRAAGDDRDLAARIASSFSAFAPSTLPC